MDPSLQVAKLCWQLLVLILLFFCACAVAKPHNRLTRKAAPDLPHSNGIAAGTARKTEQQLARRKCFFLCPETGPWAYTLYTPCNSSTNFGDKRKSYECKCHGQLTRLRGQTKRVCALDRTWKDEGSCSLFSSAPEENSVGMESENYRQRESICWKKLKQRNGKKSLTMEFCWTCTDGEFHRNKNVTAKKITNSSDCPIEVHAMENVQQRIIKNQSCLCLEKKCFLCKSGRMKIITPSKPSTLPRSCSFVENFFSSL